MEGIYRKKGDKAVPTIFPPKPKDWHERHPQFIDGVKVEPKQEFIQVGLVCFMSNKKKFCLPFGLKIGRDGRWVVFLPKSGHRRYAVLFMRVHSWTNPVGTFNVESKLNQR